ncbi:MAG TPA: class I SAM-dependent methyltransferase [Polyangiaceae bacterium]|nr:class I SAM-dependent methyltransferase [Polyangiaceae bacterium]
MRASSDFVDLQWGITIRSLTGIAPRAKGRLLDVGCGDKPYEHIFLPYVSEYIGIEHEATFSATSAEKRERKPDYVYDGNRLPFEDKTFDTVLNVQVLEHTPRPGALVHEMARVLKDDGLLILTAPFEFRLHEEPHDFFRYTPHGLKQLCAEAGLEVVHVEQQGDLTSVVGHKLNGFLALRVARLQSLGQSVGKLGHEASDAPRTRWWTTPFVVPTMAGIAVSARLLERLLHDPQSALGFLIVAKRASRAPAVRSK